jgi:hypothetical protein
MIESAWHLAGFVKAVELLRFGFTSWSAGPIPRARVPGSGRCYSPITIPMAGWSMPAALAPA